MSRRRRTKVLSVLAGASLLIAACSDDDDDGETDDSTESGCRGTEPDDDRATRHRADAHRGRRSRPGGTEAEGETPTGGTFTYGYEQEFFAYNPSPSGTNAASNWLVLNKVLPDTFVYHGGDGEPSWTRTSSTRRRSPAKTR